jgi:L-histidine Nalpha-methyltransferase
VLMGLSSKPKSLPPKYFYDAAGSKLFQEICDTKEYYPTECETEIFESHKSEIAKFIQREKAVIVELGAGDGRKTKVILEEILKAQTEIKYYPVDISRSAVEQLLEELAEQMPGVKSEGIVAEYFNALKWLGFESEARKVVFFLGGNIGNFSKPQSKVFLKTLWNSLSDDDLILTGFDLKKDIDVMLDAYNDKSGATRRFNINLLKRINKELGGEFDIEKFSHYGTYNVKLGAMESFIVSLERQSVYIKELDTTFVFKPFEAIHCEYSFKYLAEEVETLARETGFEVVGTYFDKRKYFMDAVLRVKKNPRF